MRTECQIRSCDTSHALVMVAQQSERSSSDRNFWATGVERYIGKDAKIRDISSICSMAVRQSFNASLLQEREEYYRVLGLSLWVATA